MCTSFCKNIFIFIIMKKIHVGVNLIKQEYYWPLEVIFFLPVQQWSKNQTLKVHYIVFFLRINFNHKRKILIEKLNKQTDLKGQHVADPATLFSSENRIRKDMDTLTFH